MSTYSKTEKYCLSYTDSLLMLVSRPYTYIATIMALQGEVNKSNMGLLETLLEPFCCTPTEPVSVGERRQPCACFTPTPTSFKP